MKENSIELPEPDSYLFQHEETGLTQYVDRQQVEWGFEKNNPRWQKISSAFTEKQVIASIEADRKRRGEPVAWRVHPFDYGVGYEGVYALTSRPDQVAAWERKGWEVQPLFTAPQPAEPVKVPSADAIADIVRDHLTAAYICNRVWEAWSYNTMGPDDFIEASETEMADEIAAAIVARYGQPAQPAASIKDDAFAAYQAGRAALQSQDREDAERYRCLSSMATQQADSLGPIFRIDVRRTPQTMFNFDAAVDHARRVEGDEE